ncbi:HAMP domain-containing histidine kinase [Crassaminicella thermophila]|uniref:histidine kinase n=1 Tax=Crassaminicella thermophila TaxID=2599308 RepID=A0A5C0SK64_CRATE|nr:HAMP domain-containing sensor histidine kinase [Crassaminicella thermophila]QEK13339.1 HAMP domain-containing histidine kinase [Crassaminicella thermophila]
MKKPLSKKFAFIFILTVFGAILVTSLISNYMIDKQFNQYLLEEHQRKIEKVKKLVGELYNPKDPSEKLDDRQIKRYAMLEDLYIQINDVDGNMIFSSGQSHLLHKKMMGSMMGRMMNKKMDTLLGEYIEKEFPIIKNGENIGTIVIGYFGISNISGRDIQFKNTMNQSFVISITVTLLLAFIISGILSKQMTKPLEKITKVANEMRNGNLQIRADVNTDTIEIHELCQAIHYLGDTLQQQEKLRKRLTSDMAHEIRTPLTTLQSHVEAFMDGIWEPTEERLKSCYDEILRLKKLVDHLKDLARLEQDHLYLNKSHFNLSSTIKQIIKTFQPQYLKKNLKIIMNVLPGVEVFMDEDKIKQILFNLLSNAYKYSYEGGRVEIGLKQEDVLTIYVKDEGIGISKENLPHIFERFYRAETSRSRETGGAGIGLTITKALVKAHGGNIQVESKEGEGTLFVIQFPKEDVL